MDISYVHAQQYAAWLNTLNPKLLILNGGSYANPFPASTMAQVAAAEASDARFASRISLTFAATIDTTNQRVAIEATFTIPANASTPTWTRYALIGDAYGGFGSGSGSSTIGNTSGALLYLTGGASIFSVTAVTTQAYTAKASIEMAGRPATFTP
jgi:hypothetical protein